MRRRTLDLISSAGGMVLAGLLLAVGLVFASNAHFASHYVKDQLSSEQIAFKKADALTPAERSYSEARTGCLVTNAGKQLTTGKQAECWANELMAGHLADPEHIQYSNGMSYSQLGTVQSDLRTKIATAQQDHDPALAGLQQQLTNVTNARNTVFQGEMMRNALLTSYGFSVLGDKAQTAANFAYAGALVIALLSIAGFAHALRTPNDNVVHLPGRVDLVAERPVVSV